MARILLAPLNWGLGHATRCLPIAEAFAKTHNVEVEWASDGQALALLKQELPKANIHELPAFTVRYPTSSAYRNMLRIGPGMMRAISADRRALAKLQKQRRYDLIISDNRFGCKADGAHCCILSHQIHLPLNNKLTAWMGNSLNHSFLRSFDEILVPDYPGNNSLAGKMSAPLPTRNTSYLGPVSRFSLGNIAQTTPAPNLAIILSGPEPQRSLVEQEIMREVEKTPELGLVLLVRGLPNEKKSSTAGFQNLVLPHGTKLVVENFLVASELGPVLAKAENLIVRPGYTTVMDLAALGRKAIYIPTPGQPEQEWLGKNLHKRKRGYCIAQGSLVLAKALQNLALIDVPPMQKADNHLLEAWVNTAVSRIT